MISPPQSFLRLAPVLALFLSLIGLTPSVSFAGQRQETWKIVFLNQQKIGYSYQQREEVKLNGNPAWRTQQQEKMTFTRLGKKIEIETRQDLYEKPEGELISFHLEITNPPANPRITSGEVRDKYLVLNLNQSGQNINTRLPWNRAKSPFFFEHFLRSPRAFNSASYKWTTFEPTLQKEVEYRSTLLPLRQETLLDGKQKKLRKLRIETFYPTPQKIDFYIDEKGIIQKEVHPLIGQQMEIYTTTKEVALQRIAGNELDLILQSEIPIIPIQKLHRLTETTFKIELTTQPPAELFPTSFRQKIKTISPKEINLTTELYELPNRSHYSKTEAVYLEDSRFLQYRSPEMVLLAHRAANNRLDKALLAPRLSEFVNDYIKEKAFSSAFASAPEVAKSREGDCTEHAILLAALLRAHKIPSKIVAGLAYHPGRSSFVGHMWNEAWLNGQWYPLDATLKKSIIGLTHLKVTESDLSDQGPTPEATFAPLVNIMGQAKILLQESKPPQDGSPFTKLQGVSEK